MITDVLAVSLGLAGFALLIAAATAPLETLSWWAGWTEADLAPARHPDDAPPTGATSRYIVYLSGVASISGEHLLARERYFIRGLRRRFPNATIVTDVFPYSPSGAPLLAAPRIFQRLWRGLQARELEGRRSLLRILINIRNIYQVMVAADHRYGPIFSQGAATTIAAALEKAGYHGFSGAPVTIIGFSGGAQVAVGAIPFLKARLGCPVDVVSIGGVMASDPGLSELHRLVHFRGGRDGVEKIGAVMFADRWPVAANSHWNRARREGRLEIRRLAGMTHAGPSGYFGVTRRDGAPSNSDRLLAAISDAVRDTPETAERTR